MGGAFISVADDATAAQANPAGLTNLGSPQLFAEIRHTSVEPSTLEHTFLDPFSDPAAPDGYSISVETNPESITTPSFISYVHPIKWVSLGVSRQEVLNVRNQTLNRHEFLFGGVNDIRSGFGRIDLSLVNWNFSFAAKLAEQFRIGVTVSYGMLNQESLVRNTYEDPTGALIGDTNFAGIPFEMYSTSAESSSSDVYFTGGFLWNITPNVSFGGVYRQGGEFSVDQTLVAQALDQRLVPGRITSRVFFNETGTLISEDREEFDFSNQFKVPDVVGIGLAVRPTGRLTIALDAVRVVWTDLLEDFNSRLNILTVGWQTEEEAAFIVDDQTDFHFGLEYVFGKEGKTLWAVRGGFHTEMDNRLRADFPDGEFGFGLANNSNFPAGDDEYHYSVGLGIVLGNEFQIDLAADYSTRTVEGVMSLIYKF